MFDFITLEEKIFQTLSHEAFKEWMITSDIHGFEVSVHKTLLPFALYQDFLKSFSAHRMVFHYHVPNFIPGNEFAIERWFEDDAIKKHYEAFFYQLLQLHESSSVDYHPIITFHGAAHRSDHAFHAREATRYFCDFALNLFEQFRMPFALAIETLHRSSEQWGSKRKDLVSLVYDFDTPRFGICWDMVHDARNGETSLLPDRFFLDKVLIGHLHGFGNFEDTKKDHLPLWSSELDLKEQIKYLKHAQPEVPVIHELLACRCNNYEHMLQKDLLHKQEYLRQQAIN
ncbi:apurinic/apyrimidinic endonuclease family protein [Tindallia californiensis]|uniref:Sugar phosphate isomerase/epimerase n=1 Tax=Tindallia californiensis TaxID=159292 RepID=A0A1H3QIT9_9FIRM|nr:hypothetical protein [Tindallia californiensis]SDZ12958.1 Sugar phosphate isomerase/epimerase [Tindallia californiensis]